MCLTRHYKPQNNPYTPLRPAHCKFAIVSNVKNPNRRILFWGEKSCTTWLNFTYFVLCVHVGYVIEGEWFMLCTAMLGYIAFAKNTYVWYIVHICIFPLLHTDFKIFYFYFQMCICDDAHIHASIQSEGLYSNMYIFI